MKKPYFNGPALSFDDILLIPQHSDIKSRLDVDISTQLTANIKLDIPILSTNMSTITEYDMMAAMFKAGGAGCLHRFMDIDDMCYNLKRAACGEVYPKIASVGVKDEDKANIEAFLELDKYKPDVILVDIAHGDSNYVVEMVKWLKQFPFEVIGGNVSTWDSYLRLYDAGCDAVRAGIGGGSCCTTRLITGHGVPTLTSVINIASGEKPVPLIADGGFKRSGDIVKALAFGADCVCLGGMLAATSATPGLIIDSPSGKFKEVYGMSSRTAQERHKGGLKRGIAEEGIDMLIPYKGDTGEYLEKVVGGIKSGLSYSGARNIQELRENFEYMILSSGSMKESKF